MPSRWTERRNRFRACLESDRCHHPASVFDPLSARIAEDLGYEMGMFAGSLGSQAVLGAPDLIVLTLSEFADQAHRIGRASELPILVDADHGYGNALNVMRTVEELETAGVAGLSIEDTELPRPFGPSDKAALLSIEEGTGKMRAAVAARRDPGLVIAGRTSAVSIAGIDDALARIRAYEAAGVDALFLIGVQTRDQLEAIAATASLPLILGGAGPEIADPNLLAEKRVRVCLRGHQTVRAAVQAIHDTMKALRDGVPPAELKGLASPELMRQVTRADDYARWTGDYLDGDGTS
ncbi:MAG: isocitrate lyase/PEP mutase family protein [Hyphomicrobiales bacterium]|nr:isocitrate lyase/PEP mutase family protein [Hyphomicrobiales bacterium]